MPKTTIVLGPELHRHVRHAAIDLGISFQELAVQAIGEFLERNTAKATGTSKGTRKRR